MPKSNARARTASRTTPAAYVARRSDRYREVHAQVGRAVRRVFPAARPLVEWDMAGWRISRRVPPGTKQIGTMDPRYAFVFLADRKNGITLHVWNPADYLWLEAQRPALGKAGFKVMRGCLQYTRKGDYPVAAVARLLGVMKRTLVSR